MNQPCDECLRRTWLVAALSGYIAHARERFGSLDSLLALGDRELVAALAGRDAEAITAAWLGFDPAPARRRLREAGLAGICRHDPERYPQALRDMPDPPAMVHVAGGTQLPRGPATAVVGARRATPYGLEVARMLGRGLAAAGVTVVSGMALGVDSAAHEGALEAGGPTLAVLPGGADVPYPASKRRLYRRLLAEGCAASELPPGLRPRRWCFPARNRLIAALSALTVVVEAAERSGALITARLARELGREVGAVPGPITSGRARGVNDLLFDGAHLVRDVQDVLDVLFGAGAASAPPDPRAGLEPGLRRVLDEVAGGRDTVGALAGTPAEAEAALVALSELELLGHVRRAPGGRYVPVA
ncbi:MAG: DNA-processing protein DprA [Solirubrobacteraceae bacterium]